MLKRKIENNLLRWKEQRNTSLLVKGARQVGKTFSVNKFIDENFEYSIRINFADRADLLNDFCNLKNAEQLLLRLSLLDGGNLVENKTIIFFDEIQVLFEKRESLKKQGKLANDSLDLLTVIKPLTIKGSYRFILSGSLLDVTLNDVVLYPLGYMDEVEMFPLDFEEYLWAKNIGSLAIKHLKDCYQKLKPIDEMLNKQLLEYFREYVLIGGMPEAVLSFIQKKNLYQVNETHKQIVNRYTYDITQYIGDASKRLRVREIYQAIPSELNAKNKRFVSSHVIDKNYLRNHNLVDEYLWLSNAGIAIPVYNVSEPTTPLALTSERKTLKLFVNDTGLLTSMMVDTKIREKLLNNDLEINYGAPYENIVAQQLYAHGFKERLYYYNSKKHGEVDFLVEINGEVLPIEIKSGKMNETRFYNHSALNNLISNYHYQRAYVFGETNILKENEIIRQLPIYMVSMVELN